MKARFLLLFVTLFGFAQNHSHSGVNPIKFPNIEEYLTLSTDLHIHSVFSDGNVWPTIRVQEALMDKLDAIALTEHLEYQPHLADIPHPDRNRAYELALEEAKDHDLLIIPGSEITRSAPIGHNNALFLTDSNPLLQDQAQDAFDQAKKQDAFVFWNHPSWSAQKKDGNPELGDFQKKQIKQKKLHGIEVINFGAYAEESLDIALKEDLTIMATSDVHDLIEWDYANKGLQRPVTLVFTKERSIASLKEALFAKRTVAAYNDLLVGREEFLIPLLKASIGIKVDGYVADTKILKITLINHCSSDLLLENVSGFTFYENSPVFNLEAGSQKTLQIKTIERIDEVKLSFKALGAFTAPQTHPTVSFTLNIAE